MHDNNTKKNKIEIDPFYIFCFVFISLTIIVIIIILNKVDEMQDSLRALINAERDLLNSMYN